MKKMICVILCLLMLETMAGCEGSVTVSSSQSSIPPVSSAEETAESTPDTEETVSAETEEEEVDVDLTMLSGNMMYAQVYSMVNEPDEYIGQTVKMIGYYNLYHDPEIDRDFNVCMIPDAAACCAQGVEVDLTDGSSYPEPYGVYIVIGTFDSYEEGGKTFFIVRDARRVQ